MPKNFFSSGAGTEAEAATLTTRLGSLGRPVAGFWTYVRDEKKRMIVRKRSCGELGDPSDHDGGRAGERAIRNCGIPCVFDGYRASITSAWHISSNLIEEDLNARGKPEVIGA
jgi:hypothetical protein